MNIETLTKEQMDKLYDLKREQQWCCNWCGGELSDIQTENFRTSQWGYCDCLKCGHSWSLQHILNIVHANPNAFIEKRKQVAEDEAFRKEMAELDRQEELELEKERLEHQKLLDEKTSKLFDNYDWDKEFS